MTQGIANTPVSLSLTYDQFENRVGGLGLVWKENKLMGGVKVLFPGTGVARGIRSSRLYHFHQFLAPLMTF